MKLLKHYSYVSDAEVDAARLEKRGVPTHVTAKYSQNMSRIYTGAFKAGLWVLIDDQYEDAYKFLNNSKHKITTGINQKEIQRIRQLAKPKVYEALNTAVIYGAILALFLLFVFLKIGTGQI